MRFFVQFIRWIRSLFTVDRSPVASALQSEILEKRYAFIYRLCGFSIREFSFGDAVVRLFKIADRKGLRVHLQNEFPLFLYLNQKNLQRKLKRYGLN